LDSFVYEEKLLSLLVNNDVYKIMPSFPNPISTIEKEVNHLLWQFDRKHKIKDPVYNQFKCDEGIIPKIYG